MSLMFKSKSDFSRKDSETGNLSQLHGQDRIYDYFSLFAELSPYHCLSSLYCLVLIFELMVTCLDDKKMDCFIIGLSTMLQEHMALNTGGSFPEFVSNVIIADDAIRAHKEVKKRKVVVAPSGSAPPRYQTMYHHSPTYPPRQQQHHQRQ
jgi:hypothetical protein